jgi:uncharacterized protein YjdB
MLVESAGVNGFDFINSQIVAIGDQNTKYIETKSGFSSKLNFYNIDFWGNPTQGIYMNGGTINLQSANFNQPGQNALAIINSGVVNIESSIVLPINKLLNTGGEPGFSAHSSIIDPNGIQKGDCILWQNNISNSPTVITSSAINRSGWTVSASQNTASARNAIDGVSSTRWDSQGSQQSGQWFVINFNKAEKIEQILLDVAASPGDSPKGFSMYVSDNGINWYGPALNGVGTDVMTILSFPSTSVQYVKIVQTGTKSNYWSIHEVNVFGNSLPVSVSSISLDSGNEITIARNSTQQLTATIHPENAENNNVFWVSGNISVAKVDNQGMVTAVSDGTAIITAVSMDGVKKASVKVNVNEYGVSVRSIAGNDEFKLYPNPAHLFVNYNFVLKKASTVTIGFYSVQGSYIKALSIAGDVGLNQGQIKTDDLVPGCYLLKFDFGYTILTKQLIIK